MNLPNDPADAANVLLERIAKINRTGGSKSVTGVFESLSEERISVGKATQAVNQFLLTGELEEFEPPQGFGKYEMELRREISLYRAAMRKLRDLIRAKELNFAVELINHWHIDTPKIEDI